METVAVLASPTTPTKAQQTAASAVEWAKKHGASVLQEDMVSKISKLGASGKYASNAERDFHTLIATYSKRLGATLSSARVRTDRVTCAIHNDSIMIMLSLPWAVGPTKIVKDGAFEGCGTSHRTAWSGLTCLSSGLMT